MAKTSLKAENNIEISEAKYLKPLLSNLKRSGFKLVAIEQAKNSIPYFKFKPKQNQKIVLIVGNEKTGLKKTDLEVCNQILEIPKLGQEKESLNVAIALAIVLSQIVFN